ncbi:hypothetical protein V6N13_074526 [Hibiscus sabdariffa]|uniref:Uncharacterized protein n=1 Tax=Hibiscus sabdariffa TaxID=183260 RepID=A0ABR2U9I0_9ROSI
MNGSIPPMPNLPSPRMNGPGFLPSLTSQFLLPSPTGYMNWLSPRSPYGLLSPGVQFPPLSPNFAFSPMVQSGILGTGPQSPPSPGLMFPLSPSGFLPTQVRDGGINNPSCKIVVLTSSILIQELGPSSCWIISPSRFRRKV